MLHILFPHDDISRADVLFENISSGGWTGATRDMYIRCTGSITVPQSSQI